VQVNLILPFAATLVNNILATCGKFSIDMLLPVAVVFPHECNRANNIGRCGATREAGAHHQVVVSARAFRRSAFGQHAARGVLANSGKHLE
jgi:hypothetical protein